MKRKVGVVMCVICLSVTAAVAAFCDWRKFETTSCEETPAYTKANDCQGYDCSGNSMRAECDHQGDGLDCQATQHTTICTWTVGHKWLFGCITDYTGASITNDCPGATWIACPAP